MNIVELWTLGVIGLVIGWSAVIYVSMRRNGISRSTALGLVDEDRYEDEWPYNNSEDTFPTAAEFREALRDWGNEDDAA